MNFGSQSHSVSAFLLRSECGTDSAQKVAKVGQDERSVVEPPN